jgi:predicted Zn-dependent protease
LKILASFLVICLGLLALVVWAFIPTTRNRATDADSPPNERASSPLSVNDVSPGESCAGGASLEPADTGLRREPEAADKPPPPSSTSMPPVVAGVPHDASALAPQPKVHWASDVSQRQAKERFVELRDTLVSDPYNPAALEAALELADQLEWPNEACDLLTRLVRLRPEDAALRFRLATLLMQLDRWLEAIPQLRRVIEHQPENPRAWYNLAIAHQALGHLSDARATWDRVIELTPENLDAYAHRGEVLLDLHAWSPAALDFETALRLEPESAPVDAMMNLSLALWKLGRLLDARDALLPLLEKYPEHVPALNRLAQITWDRFQANPVANAAQAGETADYCRRSLAVDANQPEIKGLFERASQASD